MLNYIWSCSCGTDTPCDREDQKRGAVWECPGCKQVWGGVFSPYKGQLVWVKISPEDVKWHDLTTPVEEEDDDE